MKNLANCTPTEFLKQAVRIREPFAAWLKRTGIPEIRKHLPDGYDDLTDEQKVEAALEQGRRNFALMMQAALEKDFDSTVNLICLFTFTDPEHFDDNPFAEYMDALLACLKSQAVKDFFTLYL